MPTGDNQATKDKPGLGVDQLAVLAVAVFVLVVIVGLYVPMVIAKVHEIHTSGLAQPVHARSYLGRGALMVCTALFTAPIVLYQFSRGYYEDLRNGKRITRTAQPFAFMGATLVALTMLPLLFCAGLWLILFS